MKHSNIYRTLLPTALMLVVASCSSDEPAPPVDSDSGRILSITVTDGGYDAADGSASRTVERGYTTEFTEGDACGLYVVRNQEIIYSNVKLTAVKDAATGNIVWEVENGTTLTGGLADEHYFLYYPYRTGMNGMTQVQIGRIDVVNFFEPLIFLWQPLEDQSSYDNYTKSDLMIAEGTADKGADNTIRLSFSMAHRTALAVIELPNAAVCTFSSSAKPLRMNDGTYRYLVNPWIAQPTIIGRYDNGHREFSTSEFSISLTGLTYGSYKRYLVSNN